MCGFTAYTRDLLVFFPKDKSYCTICDVMRKHHLVVCKICGLRAYTTEDLKRFVPRYGTKHGRGHLCLECQERTNNRAYEKRRQRLLKTLAEMAEDEYLLNRLKRSGFLKH